MSAIRRQFFLSYAVMGSVMPLLTVFLREEGGFSFLQIGLAMSLMSVPMLCSPVITTLLADRDIDPRKILAASFVCSAAALGMIYFSGSFAFTLALFFLHGLAFVAMLPLQDGYFFSLAEAIRRDGGSEPVYSGTRVWGTAGFILPSLVIFYPLSVGAPIGSILPCAVVFCFLSLANTITLPPVRRSYYPSRGLPTREALRTIFGPEARWLSVGLFFALMAATSFYAFVGNFFDEVVGIPPRYIGIIFNIGVLVEVACTVTMPWLQERIRLKGIVVLGLFCMTLRMVLLAFFPTVAMSVAVQVLHGFEVIALYIVPVVFLNRLAKDEFRNSIQGVYTMTVVGVARVLGGVAAGIVITAVGLQAGLLFGAFLSGTAFLIIAFLFQRIPPPGEIRVPTKRGA